MKQLFINLSIRSKIVLGFSLIVGVLLVVSITAYISFLRSGTAIGTFAQRVQEAGLAQQLDRDIIGLRRYSREFILLGSHSDSAKVREIAKQLQTSIQEGLEISKDSERHQHLQDASTAFESYMNNFKEIAKLKGEQNGLVDVLGTAGEILTADSLSLQNEADNNISNGLAMLTSKLTSSNLQAQMNINKMIDERDVSFAEKASSHFRVIQDCLQKLQFSAPKEWQARLNELARNLADYKSTSARITEINTQMEVKYQELQNLGGRIAEDMSKISESAALEQKAIEQSVLSIQHTSQTINLLFTLIGVVLAGVIAVSVGSIISRPVLTMAQTMRTLAGGDLNVQIPDQERHDEVGIMAQALNIFHQGMVQNRQLTAEQELSRQKRETRSNYVEGLAKEFAEQSSQALSAVEIAVTQLRSTADGMSNTAESTSSMATDVTHSAEEASTSVQTVASAAEELSSSINEIGRQVSKSLQIANNAMEKVTTTNTHVRNLADSAQKIDDVVSLINDIASQTNLLALNATIEAARAGEAGKGFAVVANEVKTLANQTARATEEITQQITSVQTATQRSVEAIDQIGSIIQTINQITTTIASSVEEQGAATQEIARNVQQAAENTQQVSSTITGVMHAASDTGHAAHDVLDAATELSRRCDDLRGSVQHFLEEIQSA